MCSESRRRGRLSRVPVRGGAGARAGALHPARGGQAGRHVELARRPQRRLGALSRRRCAGNLDNIIQNTSHTQHKKKSKTSRYI